MASNVNNLIIVFALSSMIFLYLRLAIQPVVNKSDFKFWLISWSGLTAISFLAFNSLLLFLLYGLFSLWASKKVENKIALYFMVSFVAPGYIVYTPLLNLTYQSVLGLSLLLPLFFKLITETKQRDTPKSRADLFLTLYLLLVVFLTFRGLDQKNVHGFYLTYTQIGKIALTYFLQFYLPYYVISRYVKNLDQVKTIIAASICVCLLLSPLALYEIATTSQLFAAIPTNLGINYDTPRVLRSNLLRATASIDHPLTLGMILMIGLSLFIYLSNYIKHKALVLVGLGIIGLGFIAPLSKGPWLSALFGFIIMFIFSPNKLKNGLIIVVALSIAGGVVLSSEYADKIIALLPFVGTVDTGNIDYRSVFIDQSLLIINEYPIFGVYEPRTHKAMLPLVQGEGIVDLINVYLSVALRFGLAGLTLYLGFIITVSWSLFKELILMKDRRSIAYKCGVSLIAALSSMLLALALVSDTAAVNTILLSMSGLIVAYTNILKTERRKPLDDLSNYSTSRVISN